MLKPLNTPDDLPRRRPYRVPWRVERLFESHPLVTNAGPVPVDFVRVFSWSPESGAITEHWGQMMPGESAEVCLCGSDPDDTTVTIAWFRQEDSKEYVWRFVM
ncbi:MAG TPA: hypothetical protein VFN24_02080 [Microbacterium sp.]|nr:hypothetical protein [Microbacterium sp.]